jgi:hypothetical protein
MCHQEMTMLWDWRWRARLMVLTLRWHGVGSALQGWWGVRVVS